MTVPATPRRAGPFNGNGASSAFPFTFKVNTKNDIQVLYTISGVTTVLVLDSDYSVSLNADQDATPGGTITYPISGDPMAVGEKLNVLGAVPYDQVTDLPDGGAYRARVVENTFDRTEFQIQQLAERSDRALLLAPGSTASGVLPDPLATAFIAWNADATALTNVLPDDITTTAAFGTTVYDVFIGNGSQTAWVLSEDPASLGNLDVSIEGVTQFPLADYLWTSGTAFSTVVAVPDNARMLVRYSRALAAVPDVLPTLAAPTGATLIGFKRTAVGSVAHTVAQALDNTVVNAFDFLTDAQIADVQGRSEVYDLAVPLALFRTACHGRRGFMPDGTYKTSEPFGWDPVYATIIEGEGFNSDGGQGTIIKFTDPTKNGLQVVYAYAQWAPGGGADAHVQFDIANGNTPLGNSDNLVRFERIHFEGPGAATTAGSQSIQLAVAGTETQPTGHGCFAYWANNLVLKDCWFSGWPGLAAKWMWCFGSRIEGGYYTGNKAGGVALVNTNNLAVIDGAKIIVNGMVTGPFISFNLFIGTEGASASSYPNLGVEITGNTDVEGGGGNPLPGYGFQYTADALTRTLTNIVVSGGTATANCVTPPNIAVGDYIGVYGGSVANGGLALNTVRPAIVLTKVGNAITWATSAANGAYTTGMKIGPYVAGIGLKGCFGTKVKMYAEGTTGPAIYVYDDCRGVGIAESHINDAKIYLDGYYFSVQISPGGGRGTGYAVNDEFTLNGGVLVPGGSPTRLKVTAQTSGQVFGLAYVNQGQYLEPPLGTGLYNVIATTTQTGTGSGAVCISTWYANSAEGVAVERNQMYGSNGGITSVCHENVTLEGNQYLRSGPEQPRLDLGVFIRTLSPKLRETGARISKGMMVGSGINQYIGPAVAADITNFAAGVGALQNLEGANDYTLPLAGKRNTGVGYRPGRDLTTGANNIFMGTDVGIGITTGDGNVIIDAAGSTCASGLVSFLGLGFGSAAFAADNRVQLGSTNISSARVQVSWTITSDSRAKADIEPLDLGMNLVRLLEPKSYFRKDANGDATGKEELGLTAQGVLSALQTLGRGDHGMVDYDTTNDLYGLRLGDLTPVLIKAAQEIDARQDSLEARIAALEIL